MVRAVAALRQTVPVSTRRA